LKIPTPNFNDKTTFSASITVFEKISGPIDLSLEISRCTLDLKTCTKHNVYNFRECCKKLSDNTQFYSHIFPNIEPTLKCPILPGNYTLAETTFSFVIIELLPIDGYYYITTANIVSTEKDRKTRKVAFCLKLETKITKKELSRRKFDNQK
jgi:hypothetical protein